MASYEYPLQKQSPKARVNIVDALRAFALFGILFIHSVDEFLSVHSAEHFSLSNTDSVITYSVQAFIHNKFYIIFSFLFGWGFYTMYQSARKKNQPFLKTYLWRLAILLAIGTLHSLLYYDILQIYAVIAPILLLFRNFGIRQLLVLSVLLFLASTTCFAFREQLWDLLVLLKQRGVPVPGKVVQYVVTGRLFMTASMFVLGLCAGKAKVFKQLPNSLPLFHRLALGSCIVSLVTFIVFFLNKLTFIPSADKAISIVESVCYSVQAVSLACFYVSTLAILYCQTSLRKVLDWITPLGKVSLTGYLMQSVFIVLFYNYSYGQAVGIYGAMVFTFLFYLGQVLFASLWLSYFKMGPVEWLWRLITYFKWSSPVKERKALA